LQLFSCDYQCAKAAGLDFVFIHGWIEVANWQRFAAEQGVVSWVGAASVQFEATGFTFSLSS
jgi:hypothetical protein